MKTDETAVSNIEQLLSRASVKFRLLDYNSFITAGHISPVSESSIFEANSKSFHPDGLFSESIFGPVTSMERFTTFAYIPLNTKIIHPVIYAEVVARRKLYTGIISGVKQARWDATENDFTLAVPDDPKAETGYGFFLRHFHKLARRKTSSLKSANKFELIKKYKDNLTITNYLVLPAGLRDIKLTSARLAQDDINKSYLQLLSLTTSLSDHALSDDAVFDSIRYNIQTKVHDVFLKLYSLMHGKGGFLQGHFAKRKVVLSTRNVASAMIAMGTTPNDPLTIKTNEAAIPLLNTIKAFQGLFVKFIRKDLYGEVIQGESLENIPLTDMTTFDTAYVEVRPSEIKKYNDSKEIGRIINQFRHPGFRSTPVSMRDSSGKLHCLMLVFISGNNIYLGKNKDELKKQTEVNNDELILSEVRPLSWAEALYMAAEDIAKNRHAIIARYPITGESSVFVAKVIPISTIDFITGTLHFNDGVTKKVARYPMIDSIYTESISISSSRLSGLGAD